MLLWLAFSAGITVWLVIAKGASLSTQSLGFFVAVSIPGVLLNYSVDRLNRKRFGTVLLSHDSIGFERKDGVVTWFAFSDVERVEAIRPGSPDYIMARWQRGIRLVARDQKIIVYESIGAYGRLRRSLEETLQGRSIPCAWM